MPAPFALGYDYAPRKDGSMYQVAPKLARPESVGFDLGGFIGDRIRANAEHWILVAPDANPAMLQMMRDRDRQPVRDLVPWAGEFAGKYLTSALQCYRLTRDERLYAYVAHFVRDLIDTQAEDGYLGAFPHRYRLTGRTIRPNGEESDTWDAWNHYHCLLGLLFWHEETGDAAALAACRRIGDLFCRTFLDTGARLVATGSEEMNLAPIHALCLLYARTGEQRYFRLAREIERDFETPPAGDYVRTALAGLDFYQTPKPRWESLHDIQGIAELYFLTGDDAFRRAFEQIWRSIQRGDRHNTGGFSSGEKATGNPYDPGAIETCCTIAWMALSIDFLRMTGDSTAADEIERSTYNALLGAQSPTGRWWTYNTPMDGTRKASAHDIVFQARAGSPELNCCSVNGPRGLGMLADWAVMADEANNSIALNYYGRGQITLTLPSGIAVTLTQDTEYPRDGIIHLHLEASRPERIKLRLRIPGWSRVSDVALNGDPVADVVAGTYLSLDRIWTTGDVVRLTLDFTPWIWRGEREAAGKASIYRGPILLAYDQRFNAFDPSDIPAIDLASLNIEPTSTTLRPEPLFLATLQTENGPLALCDFASAGAAGNPYVTWLPVRG
jgi:hypothetical protein